MYLWVRLMHFIDKSTGQVKVFLRTGDVPEYRGQDVNQTQWISGLSPNNSAVISEPSTGLPENKSIPVSAELTAKVTKMHLSQGNHSTTQGNRALPK
jgi:hypothetical protein